MPRFQMKPKCLFVDALHHKKPEVGDYRTGVRKPDDLPFPLVMDQSSSPAKYLALNDTAGFIARFIVQGVDTDWLLPQIIQSEYGISPTDAAQEVEKVKTTLMPYLAPRSHKRTHQKPKVDKAVKHSGKFPLDFSVNFLGATVLKGPL
jgi:hypothetical protein